MKKVLTNILGFAVLSVQAYFDPDGVMTKTDVVCTVIGFAGLGTLVYCLLHIPC